MKSFPSVSSRSHAGVSLFALLVVLGGDLASAAVTEVATCGQTVSGKGVFTQDLDCTGFVGDALTLAAGASVDFAGFTLTGGTGDAVGCEGKCTVYSSAAAKGVIQNAGGTGVSSKAFLGLRHKVKVRVRDMRITGNGGDGIGTGVCCSPDRAVVLDSEISGNAGGGVGASTKASVRRSVVSSNEFGVSAGIVAVTDTVSENNVTVGINSGLFGFRVRNTRANGNGTFGFSSAGVVGGIRIRDCEAIGNTLDGVHFRSLSGVRVGISESTFSNNGRDGIRFDDGLSMTDVSARIRNTTISENGSNGLFVGPDEPLGSIVGRGITATSNGEAGMTGAFSDKGVKLRSSTLTDNGTFGLRNLAPSDSPGGPCPVSAGASTFSGNGLDPDCGVAFSCADVAACDLPDLASDVVCETSYDTDSGFPGATWGLCSAD